MGADTAQGLGFGQVRGHLPLVLAMREAYGCLTIDFPIFPNITVVPHLTACMLQEIGEVLCGHRLGFKNVRDFHKHASTRSAAPPIEFTRPSHIPAMTALQACIQALQINHILQRFSALRAARRLVFITMQKLRFVEYSAQSYGRGVLVLAQGYLR